MDFELEEELRNTDELLENLQAREGRLGKSKVQPLLSPPTVQWRKRDSQDTFLEELKRLLDTKEGDDNVMPMQDHQPRSASNDWTIRTEMREERWKEARSSLVLYNLYLHPQDSARKLVKFLLNILTQKALQVQQHTLEALKTELSLHDDTVHQWVSDVQQWAEENDRHGSGDARRLQEEIEGLTVSIKRRTQRLYSQTDSNKRRHSLRLRRSEEKKKLAAAVEEYNSIADPSQQLGSVEDFFSAETVAWPWQIPCSTELAPFLTKRKVFDKVMAVRRLQEERALFPTLSDTACKGLLCIVRKKHYELRHLMQLVKAGYVKIFSQQDLMSEEEKFEQEDDLQEEGLSDSDNCSDDEHDFP
ncbi:unnamed protein product [Leuciscus chuanchicus]